MADRVIDWSPARWIRADSKTSRSRPGSVTARRPADDPPDPVELQRAERACATRPDNRGADPVPFFWKQWGNWRPVPADRATHVVEPNGNHHARFGEDLASIRHRGAALVEPGTPKANGNLLDGERHEAFPS